MRTCVLKVNWSQSFSSKGIHYQIITIHLCTPPSFSIAQYYIYSSLYLITQIIMHFHISSEIKLVCFAS